ncbi:hypothetical protein GIB67_002720 [Kingdonia uniflora]|uniref:C2 domain-containing protein n=1 Tax=Kingdonia uniflora TaxID=39325 RepID=A0A7J7LJL9_9MAGN|nr:hypothetical protein GIB67_002720 [Kingdonia uniflora]
MLVVISPFLLLETWFTVDEKDPIAYAKVEVIEAADMKPSDMNGLADPYVKGQLGPYRFRTKTQKKTLAPKWLEEFKIPICTWDSPNVLALEVRDKDYLVDDTLGDCSINISDLRSGQRQDIWLPLKNIKIGRLHLAVTVLDVDGKEGEHTHYDEPLKKEERTDYVQSESAQRASNPNISLEKDPKIADDFEPINIEGQEQTGIWVHHPGSDVSKMWEPRKRKSKRSDINIHKENKDAIDSPRTNYNPNSRSDENAEGSRKVKPLNVVRRSLRNIGSTFHRSPRNEDHNLSGEISPSPRVNLHAINERGTVVNFIVDDDLFGATNGSKESKEILSHTERNEGHNPTKGHMKGMGKSILKHAERSAHGLKHVLSRKSSNKSRMDSESTSTELENTNSSDEESQLSSMQYTPKDALVPVDSTPTPTPVLDRSVESHEHKKQNDQIGATGSELPPKSTYIEERDMEVPPNVVGRD